MNGVIVIDNEYGIKAMEIDYALVKFRTVKGERRAEPVLYYSTISKCLEAWAKIRLHDEFNLDADISLSEAIERIHLATDSLKQAIKAAFPDYKVIADE